MRWLTRLWSSGKEAAAPAPGAVPAVAPPLPPAISVHAVEIPVGVAAQSHALLPWLLGSAAPTADADAPLGAAETSALEALDKVLALPEIPGNLLPRAAALIPQLISLLRQTSLPTTEIAARVSKDALLSAELMRLASSPYYRSQSAVGNLEEAITLIGLQGLQTVIARVILKPIYQTSPGPLSARAAQRLWEHSEALARHAAIAAGATGQSVFDAYLVGMLHNTGWTVALCVLDRSGIALSLPSSTAFAELAAGKAHRLFGLAAQSWDITPGFTAFAKDARQNAPATSTHPLALTLQAAQQHSMDELSPT